MSIEDWYNVSGADLSQYGARKLLNRHSGSPGATIRALFPSHEWLPWKFAVSAKGYWKSKDNQGKDNPACCTVTHLPLVAVFMEWLGNTLGFSKMEHWYGIKGSDFIVNGAAPFIQQFGCSPYLLMTYVYPYPDIHLYFSLFLFLILFFFSRNHLTRLITMNGINGDSHA